MKIDEIIYNISTFGSAKLGIVILCLIYLIFIFYIKPIYDKSGRYKNSLKGIITFYISVTLFLALGVFVLLISANVIAAPDNYTLWPGFILVIIFLCATYSERERWKFMLRMKRQECLELRIRFRIYCLLSIASIISFLMASAYQIWGFE